MPVKRKPQHSSEPQKPPRDAMKSTEQSLTVLWHQLEDWQRDNHYITSGYRPSTNSYWKSAASLGYLHNESVNIYTHLVGAVIALVGSIIFYSTIKPRFERATDEDVLVFSCFFLGAVACLGMSATFHTIANHSELVCKFGNKLDYIGIVLLIWGSFIPSIYYGFGSEPALIRRYWSMITTIAAGTLTVVILPRFRTAAWRPFRAFMFVAMGLSAVFPVLHGLRLFGIAQMQQKIGLYWLLLQGVLYIAGAFLYAARIPERWRPGSFDIWGSSHQIFHVFVLIAAASHLVGLLIAFDHEHSFRGQLTSLSLTAKRHTSLASIWQS